MKAIIAVIVLVLVGLGVFFVVNQDSSNDELVSNQEVEEVGTEATMQETELPDVGTLDEIMAKGNVKCDYRAEVVNQDYTSVTEGVIYHADDKVRVDSVILNEGTDEVVTNSLDSSTIILDNVSYTWSSMGAVKIDLAEIETFEANMREQYGDLFIDESTDQTSLLDQDFEYSCERWSVDSSVFELPTDVEFIDMIEMMESNMGQLEEMRGMMEGFELPELQ